MVDTCPELELESMVMLLAVSVCDAIDSVDARNSRQSTLMSLVASECL